MKYALNKETGCTFEIDSIRGADHQSLLRLGYEILLAVPNVSVTHTPDPISGASLTSRDAATYNSGYLPRSRQTCWVGVQSKEAPWPHHALDSDYREACSGRECSNTKSMYATTLVVLHR